MNYSSLLLMLLGSIRSAAQNKHYRKKASPLLPAAISPLYPQPRSSRPANTVKPLIYVDYGCCEAIAEGLRCFVAASRAFIRCRESEMRIPERPARPLGVSLPAAIVPCSLNHGPSPMTCKPKPPWLRVLGGSTGFKQ
jgi:hypothetical protein